MSAEQPWYRADLQRLIRPVGPVPPEVPPGAPPQRAAGAPVVVFSAGEHETTELHGLAALGAVRGVAGHVAHLIGGRSGRRAGMRYAVGGLNLSPRQSATTVGQSIDQARVCLAAPPPVSATLSGLSTRASRYGRPVTTAREPSAGEAAIIPGWFGRCPGANCRTVAPSGPLAFTVIPRCSPLDLVLRQTHSE